MGTTTMAMAAPSGFLFLLAAVIVSADDEVTARVNALLAKHHAQHGHFKDTAALIKISESVLGPASHNAGRKPLWMSSGNVQEAAPYTSSEETETADGILRRAHYMD